MALEQIGVVVAVVASGSATQAPFSAQRPAPHTQLLPSQMACREESHCLVSAQLPPVSRAQPEAVVACSAHLNSQSQ